MSVPTRDDIKTHVVNAFCMVSSNDNVDESYSIIFDIGIDSLDIAEVIMEIEDSLDINIEIEDVAECKTVSDVVESVCKILKVN